MDKRHKKISRLFLNNEDYLLMMLEQESDVPGKVNGKRGRSNLTEMMSKANFHEKYVKLLASGIKDENKFLAAHEVSKLIPKSRELWKTDITEKGST